MRCPFCSFPESKVVDSRAAEDGAAIRRRRECLQCARRFTTYETMEAIPVMVVKKDGRRETFERNKLLNGLVKACEKRKIAAEALADIAHRVEREVLNTMEREISSQQIGEMVMEQLRDLDEVAYVRFASVYRHFTDINKFMQELEALLKRPR
ncbi:MAG TPA: transcriptional regulator NrdR [Firmicutes bacterium]|nr:transcriptional regulator NrdR [Bacillota bacterium]HWR56784.1 transcriptional regulator NrdR [Negativicutes bacterium]